MSWQLECLSHTSHTHTTLNHHSFCSNIFILYVACSSFLIFSMAQVLFIFTHSISLLWFTIFIHYYYFQFTPCTNVIIKVVLQMNFFLNLFYIHDFFSLCFKVEIKTLKVMALIIKDFLTSNFNLKMCGMVLSFHIILTFLIFFIY